MGIPVLGCPAKMLLEEGITFGIHHFYVCIHESTSVFLSSYPCIHRYPVRLTSNSTDLKLSISFDSSLLQDS